MDEPIDHADEARRELLGAEITRAQWFRTWQGGDDAQAAHLAETVQHCLAAAQVHATLALLTAAVPQ